MPPHVLRQAAGLCECLAARLADMRPLPRMRPKSKYRCLIGGQYLKLRSGPGLCLALIQSLSKPHMGPLL